jgi:hypothetical protein
MRYLDENMSSFDTGGIQFSAVKIDRLMSSSYTLVNIGIDTTGSVWNHTKSIQKMVKDIIEGCRKCPRVDNLMIRIIEFNSGNINEIHGFKTFNLINVDDYKEPIATGTTNLIDAGYDGLSGIDIYSTELSNNDFESNGLNILITDGMDNISKYTCKDISNKINEINRKEKLESLLNILIGLTDKNATDFEKMEVKEALEKFKVECNFDAYIDVDDMSAENFAKIAKFIVNSVSSQSSSLGSGGPSQIQTF